MKFLAAMSNKEKILKPLYGPTLSVDLVVLTPGAAEYAVTFSRGRVRLPPSPSSFRGWMMLGSILTEAVLLASVAVFG